MNYQLLKENLDTAHVHVLLCRAQSGCFRLNSEESAELAWKLQLHLRELNFLLEDIQRI